MAAADSLLPPSPLETREHESGSFPSGSSDRRIWSALRRRADGIVEDGCREGDNRDRSKRLKEDSMLLLRGFDSVACTLSQLSENVENALQGARELAKPPTLTDIFHSREVREQREDDEEKKKPPKRKFESASSSCSDDQSNKSESLEDNLKRPVDAKLKRAKNLAASMATKAASFARELGSLKSDLSFLQERCALLEEENKRLKEGFAKGIRPEEDDLVRLQLETLLAEKSRLANENANLVRENQCLNQLVTYHQLTTQDLTETYEQAIQSMCLGFASPIAEEEAEDGDLGDENVHLSLIRHIDFFNPLDG
ncbi:hypothetical protein MLD38_031810 [Melastoma candidum]|uniref:Uncharacterized protein n=1 Tax=Melastoma candidum TaxID=119954 RepID=A0ACB9MQ71_9MYRT|nr:hypothetical protein MLD38_031810 [Melastoma candidum]